MAAGDRSATDSLEVVQRIEEGFPIVDAIARGMKRQFGGYMTFEDLVSQGRESLLHAARTFDPDRGVPFKRWAAIRARGAMIDSVRQGGNLPKRVYRKLRALQAMDHVQENAIEEQSAAPAATAEAADKALGDQLGTAAMAAAVAFLALRRGDELEAAKDPDHSPESNVSYAEMLEKVRAAIEERPEQERALLNRVYFDELTIDEAARELGLSKSWGSRIHARAIEGLAKSMKRGRVG